MTASVLAILAQDIRSLVHRLPDWPVWADVAAAVLAGVIVHLVFAQVVRRLLPQRAWLHFANLLFERLRRPGALVWPLLFLVLVRTRHRAAVPMGTPLPFFDQALLLAFIAALTWMVIRLIGAAETWVKWRHDVEVADNREARRVHTQVHVLSRALQGLVIVAAVAVGLMTFPRIQQIGTSLLASAGIAGVIIGLAARPVLENFIAGLQIGFTQPIRIDDVVIIQGEFGWVEEIGITYIVVRLWDERRLIVPFSKFISEPFQNWTRTGSHILGTVEVWVDYATPVERVREAAREITSASPLWDGRVYNLQVTSASEQAVQLRILISAFDAAGAWDLRVHVREKLIDFLQRELPDALPRRRIVIEGDRPRPPPGQ
jgi:small-conductance mechanosensitive channel